jgi:hypothetical protein
MSVKVYSSLYLLFSLLETMNQVIGSAQSGSQLPRAEVGEGNTGA